MKSYDVEVTISGKAIIRLNMSDDGDNLEEELDYIISGFDAGGLENVDYEVNNITDVTEEVKADFAVA